MSVYSCHEYAYNASIMHVYVYKCVSCVSVYHEWVCMCIHMSAPTMNVYVYVSLHCTWVCTYVHMSVYVMHVYAQVYMIAWAMYACV